MAQLICRSVSGCLGAVLLASGQLAAGAQAGPLPLLHEIFTDHAVLQRDRPIEVFGNAQPGESVSVTLDQQRAAAHADAAGRWHLSLPALPAGGPHTLTARSESGRSEQVLDLLSGDVFVCSGQSNMELAVSSSLDAAREISTATGERLRLLSVAHATAAAPLEHFADPVQWQVASPQSVRDFSAACYYFARELQRTQAVPIGLIHASWGGSRIEPWISRQGLASLAGYAERLTLLDHYAQDPARAERELGEQWQRWWHSRSPSPAAPWRDVNPAGWTSVPLPLRDWKTWGVPALATHDGMVWFRRRFVLTAAQAAQPAHVSIGAIDEVDQTWLNGEPIGNSFGYGTERRYSLPANVLHAGENLLVINVLSTWDAGGMYGPAEHLQLELAGQAPLSLAGDWQYQAVPEAIGYPPRAPWESVSGLTSMYNAMIAPLTPLRLRGVLWYQGESNAAEALTYQSLLTTLFRDWRDHFRSELPFLVVQLPNFGKPVRVPGESAWAALREAQRLAVAADPRAALAVSIDVGEAQNLHPLDKQSIGRRLARAARALIYREPVTPSGPQPVAARREGGEVRVNFAALEGSLRAQGALRPVGFELCGSAAGSCHYVDGRLQGDAVSLSIAAGPSARVRYCWADVPLCNLSDDSDLPAVPFELDVGP